MSNENLTETKPVEQAPATEKTTTQATENLLTTKTENAENRFQSRGMNIFASILASVRPINSK